MPSLPTARLARLDADEFEAMIESGALGDRRVLLWGGKIYEKMARTHAHAFVAGTLSDALMAIVPAGWVLRHENPIRLDPRHVPLPDMVVIRGPRERYRDAGPHPHEVGLVVEVAVTSLAKDLGVRAARYAEAGVASYWVADAANRRIVEHRGPRVEGGIASYESIHHRASGDTLGLILDGAVVGRILVADLF